MTKWITVLIDPNGNEFYEAYGPMTTDRDKATRFTNEQAAARVPQRFGRSGTAFWNSERESEARAEREFRGWTHRYEKA